MRVQDLGLRDQGSGFEVRVYGALRNSRDV